MTSYTMSSLRDINNEMRKNNVFQVTFPFVYNQKTFSCIFINNLNPYRLYMTTLGREPITLEFEIKAGYKINIYIENDKYKALLEYLDLSSNNFSPFKPVYFFQALNEVLPSTQIRKARRSEVFRTVNRVRQVEEADKVYFIGWRRLPSGQNVSSENNEKTRLAFGDEIANVCLDRNISSCWTDIPTDEKAVDFSKLYN